MEEVINNDRTTARPACNQRARAPLLHFEPFHSSHISKNSQPTTTLQESGVICLSLFVAIDRTNHARLQLGPQDPGFARREQLRLGSRYVVRIVGRFIVVGRPLLLSKGAGE